MNFLYLAFSALIAGVLSQPRYVSYVDRVSQWWPAGGLAAGLGLPSYAGHASYNVINLSYLAGDRPHGMALIWSDPVTYFGRESSLGETKE